MSLAVYMMVSTIGIFALGAAFALAWSFAAGHWNDLSAQAMLVFDEDDEAEGVAHAR